MLLNGYGQGSATRSSTRNAVRNPNFLIHDPETGPETRPFAEPWLRLGSISP